MIATHLCEVDESKILDMNYLFYKSIIRELSIKFNYGTVQFLMARDYGDEKISKHIEEANPFNVEIDGNKSSQPANKRVTLGMLKNMGVIK